LAVHDSIAAAVVVSPGADGRELDDELRDHLERKTEEEEYVAQGMTLEEAYRRARLDLGGIEQTKGECRDARRLNWIHDLIQDLHYGVRGFEVARPERFELPTFWFVGRMAKISKCR
jgi:hypothetical protein